MLELTNTTRFSEDLRSRSRNASVALSAPTRLTSRTFRYTSRLGGVNHRHDLSVFDQDIELSVLRRDLDGGLVDRRIVCDVELDP